VSAPLLSIVVLSWNTEDLLRTCLERLAAAELKDAEVIVVDNASSDGSAAMVRTRFPGARLIVNERNLGYAAGNNVGIAAARGRYVFLLNSDTEVEPDATRRMVEYLEAHPDCGAVAARLLNLDGTVQRACKRFPTLAVAIGFDTWFGKRFPFARVLERYDYAEFDHLSSRDVAQPPAAALMLPARVLAEVGTFDEDLFLFFNDVDLCRRIHARGWRIHYLAEARIKHHCGASTRKFGNFAREWHLNRARYYLRAYGEPGFALAKLMTCWRALEQWNRFVRPMTIREERRAATREIVDIVRAVVHDQGIGDERVRRGAMPPMDLRE
jgi:GT2 family glycosyltransferase